MLKQASKMMSAALKEAEKAFEKNCIPIGAVIIIDNKIIARAHNGSKENKIAHAEILCIQKALKKNIDLTKATIFVTLEPCAMCMHAIRLARIKTVCFGASNSNEPLPQVEVIKGIKKDEALKLMREFFEKKR